MERFIHLARRLHRRSVWQVFVIHVAGAWVAFQACETVAAPLKLPTWFPEFALIVLLLGVPVTVTTAYVQRGFGSDEEPREEDALGSVFNWRNAIAGGLAALLLLVIVAVGWLALAEHLVDEFHRTPG